MCWRCTSIYSAFLISQVVLLWLPQRRATTPRSLLIPAVLMAPCLIDALIFESSTATRLIAGAACGIGIGLLSRAIFSALQPPQSAGSLPGAVWLSVMTSLAGLAGFCGLHSLSAGLFGSSPAGFLFTAAAAAGVLLLAVQAVLAPAMALRGFHATSAR